MGRPRNLPNLRDYLDRRKPVGIQRRLGWFSVVTPLAVVGILYGGWLLGAQSWLLAGVTMCAGPVIFMAIMFEIERKLKEPRNDAERVIHEISALHAKLANNARDGKLHRKIDAVAAVILEEVARQWLRIQATLEQPLWTRQDLPSHWKGIRQQSLAAADEAMDEIIVLLKSNYREQPKRDEWESVFRDLVEDVFGVAVERRADRIPPEFEPARRIGEKLRDLAVGVESASLKLIEEMKEPSSIAPSSTSSIDMILGELRAIEMAESELNEQGQNG